MPNNYTNLERLFNLALKTKSPYFIRFPKENIENVKINDGVILEIGKWVSYLKSNSKLVIICVGPILDDLINFVNINKLDIDIINAIFIKPFDKEALNNIIVKNQNTLLIDIYSVKEGLSNAVSNYLLENNFKAKFKSLTLPNNFVTHGSNEDLFKSLSIDLESIKDLIMELYEN